MEPARRATVLLTGMSGTGKSSVLAALAGRGHAVLDTDDPGWTVVDDGEPVWDLARIGAALDAHHTGLLFVAGCVVNQGRLYDRFDRVVLLSAPLETLLERVRARTNPYGSTTADRVRIAADLAAVEPLLRAGAHAEIDTTVPLGAVVAAVETLAIHVRDDGGAP